MPLGARPSVRMDGSFRFVCLFVLTYVESNVHIFLRTGQPRLKTGYHKQVWHVSVACCRTADTRHEAQAGRMSMTCPYPQPLPLPRGTAVASQWGYHQGAAGTAHAELSTGCNAKYKLQRKPPQAWLVL